jgi:UDP-N-acetylmuramoyl-L-alanyl-D-glutamate--2,6-diaminopimelate ligase
MFVAIRGVEADGHRFIDEAVRRGASVVVLEDDGALPDSYFSHARIPKIVVRDSRKALALIAGNLYRHPSERLRLIGVTGTNGKTTTVHLIRSVLQANGSSVGFIGTTGHHTGSELVPASHTTPESLELNSMLSHMIDNGCSDAVMEVSSHALALSRVHGLQFVAAAFTNLTQDHLDFHGTMEEYFKAKKLLFDSLPANSYAIGNADDPRGKEIISSTAATPVLYGTTPNADVYGRDISTTLEGIHLNVVYQGTMKSLWSPLIGRFNAANLLTAYATCVSLGVDRDQVHKGLSSLSSVPGRFERIRSPQGWMAVVDYAHTPDALQNCLQTIRELIPPGTGRLITVFGCGGNRDRLKRPLMGSIASRLSDITIITSDNPRLEDPDEIIREILKGVVVGRELHTEVDRQKAIAVAVSLARNGDVVLVAGKGHETYQIIGKDRIHFDDREEVRNIIKGRHGSHAR